MLVQMFKQANLLQEKIFTQTAANGAVGITSAGLALKRERPLLGRLDLHLCLLSCLLSGEYSKLQSLGVMRVNSFAVPLFRD